MIQQHHPQHPTSQAGRFELVVESKMGFDETVEAVKKAAEAEKFSVQGVHEISKVLESKGFPREKLTIVEVCNAKLASEALKNDIRAGLMIPCPVMVYEQNGKVMVATFDGDKMAAMYEGPGMASVGSQVGKSLATIVHSIR